MEQSNKSNKKIWLNLVIVIVILLTVITVIGSMHDLNEVVETLKDININYYIGALVMSLVSLLLMSVSSQIVIRAINKELDLTTGFLIQATEPFFNGITPFSSGAQPFQIYFYHKHNVDPKQSTSVLIVNFILFQIVSVVLSTIGLIVYWNQIFTAVGWNISYILVGYAINTSILVGLFLLAYVKKAYKLFEKLFEFFKKFKFTRNKATKLKEKSLSFVHEFQEGAKFLFTKKRVFLLSSSLKLLSLALQFSTTILIAMSLNLHFNLQENIFMIFAGLLAVTTMMFVPLPGASGGTELAFTLLMGTIFRDSNVILSLVTVMLLWRVATYYFGMFYGFIAYLFLQRRKVKS